MSQPSFVLAVLLLWNFGLLLVDRILRLCLCVKLPASARLRRERHP